MAPHQYSLLSIFLLYSTFSLTSALNANGGGFSVDLIHRDSPDSPFYNPSETPSQRIAEALRRSISRANHFKPTSSPLSPNEPRSEVFANKGEYLMKYSVGTPPFPVLGIADTGSDLIWLQCKPCSYCYEQKDPIFYPRESKTYRNVACTSTQCQSIDGTSCSSSSCKYSVSYGDRSYSNGDLALETLTLESTTSRPVSLRNIVVGCGRDNNGTFDKKSSGIVGLGGGAASLVSQLGSSIGKMIGMNHFIF
jgi:hypothetical protein